MKLIFSDFDGTLTHHTRMSPVLFDILKLAEKNNIKFIIVSGRSLSWGHFFLTHFDNIHAAIMEGGGVIVTRHNQGYMEEEYLVTQHELYHLDTKAEEVQKLLNIKLSVDSLGRSCDRAIELNQYSDEVKNKIFDFFNKNQINYSCSNVHINFWAGEISKYKAVEHYMKKYFSNIDLKDCIYFGDAPNDESMFKFFKNSVGVSNIKTFLDKITYKPKVILEGTENAGPDGVYNYLKKIVDKV